MRFYFNDFDLAEWRLEEMNTINQSLSGAERKAALCQLLDQETQLIASIGRHKIEADTDNKQKQIEKFLDQVRSSWAFFAVHPEIGPHSIKTSPL